MHYNYTCLTWLADTETLDCTHVANTAACVADCQHRNVITQNMLTLPGIIVWPHSLQLNYWHRQYTLLLATVSYTDQKLNTQAIIDTIKWSD